MYMTNDTVVFKRQRCACVGGGYTEDIGAVIGIVSAPNGIWYQINTPSGVATVKELDMIRKLNDS